MLICIANNRDEQFKLNPKINIDVSLYFEYVKLNKKSQETLVYMEGLNSANRQYPRKSK